MTSNRESIAIEYRDKFKNHKERWSYWRANGSIFDARSPEDPVSQDYARISHNYAERLRNGR